MIFTKQKPPSLLLDDGDNASRVIERLLRSEFVTRYFSADGKTPFSFKGRGFWRRIYDRACSKLVLMTGRQTGKTTYVSNYSWSEAITVPGTNILVVAAYKDQVAALVREKFNSQIRYNLDLFGAFLGAGSINNLQAKVLSNNSSITFGYAATSSEQLRGITAPNVIFDECQSLSDDRITIIGECSAATPDIARHKFTGTPLSSINPLVKRFMAGSQYEWIITCCYCHFEHEPLSIANIDLKKKSLFCLDCGKPLDPSKGRWIAMNPDATYDSYRICSLMLPGYPWRNGAGTGILDKFQEYSEARFTNEVLGQPFDHGLLPITEAELHNCCTDEQMVDPATMPGWVTGQEMFMSLDWAWNSSTGGQSYTICAIAAREGNAIKVLYFKRFAGPQYSNPDTVLREIVQLVRKFGVRIIGTDFGIGHKENIRLRASLPNMVIREMLYGSETELVSYDDYNQRYNLSRTMNIDLIIFLLKQVRIKFPRLADSREFLSDILHVRVEQNCATRRHSYQPTGDGPDDFLHLLVYLRVIIKQFYGM